MRNDERSEHITENIGSLHQSGLDTSVQGADSNSCRETTTSERNDILGDRDRASMNLDISGGRDYRWTDINSLKHYIAYVHSRLSRWLSVELAE